MDSSLTRRQIAKGVAWSTPVIIGTSATPVYAASPQLEYGDSEVWQTTMNSRSFPCNSNITISNTAPGTDGSKPGFTIYAAGGSPQTTATLNSLVFYAIFPKTWAVSNFSFNSGSSTWRNDGKVTVSSLPMENGSTLNTSNYDVFKFTFIGTTSGYTVLPDGSETTWPGSTFSASATSTQYCPGPGRTITTYGGYEFGYTLANGAVNYPANSLSSIKSQTATTR